VGVAAYPEVHVESPNDAYCLKHLKQKIDNGADYIVTQMFFDNRLFFAFVDKCRAAGIEVPIIPGIKVATSKNQITSLPRNFKVSMPEELVDAITASPRQAKKIGVNWTIRQCRELLDHGVPCIHFFVLNDVDVVSRVVEKVY
jgi:methylenetetrahydrofolate reductase (NADPH)